MATQQNRGPAIVAAITRTLQDKDMTDVVVRPDTAVDGSLGLDSLDWAAIVVELESELGIDPSLLSFIAKNGGSIPIRDLHTHSLVFYQAGHQAFSQLMEGLTADEYVTFDDDERLFRLTDKGRAFLESQAKQSICNIHLVNRCSTNRNWSSAAATTRCCMGQA